MLRFQFATLAVFMFVAHAATAHAHIKMLKPTPWITTDATGNPQKQGPCGTGTPGSAATNEVTTFMAGEEITVEWTETVDHPGHFRIALAKDRAELKDPDLKPAAGTCDYPAGSVPTEPHDNVLLDNLFPTTGASAQKMYSQKVKLPSEPCEKCTLQLIQWMTKHPPSCLYYQCADIRIVAAGSQSAGSTAPAAGSGGASGGSGGASGSAGGSGDAAKPTGESASDDSDGCSVRPGHTHCAAAWLTALVAIAWVLRRRRNRA